MNRTLPKLTTAFIIIHLMICLCISTSAQNRSQYEWFPSNTGGGGYITGLVQDKNNPDVLYARCDVGGVFKSLNKGKEWFACNNGLKRWYNHSVQSIAIGPENNKLVFRCSGDKRNNTIYGSIHKSTDGGASWYEVLDKVGFYGNGETRMYGELIAIDPFNSKNVFTAGITNGVWTSDDEGETWVYRFGKDESFSTVAIHPYKKNQYFAATLNGKLFFSKDNGKTWTLLFTATEKTFGFTELAFDSRSSSTIYCSSKNGVYRSLDGGKTFDQIMEGLPAKFQYNTIVSHPADTRVLYTAPDVRPGHREAPIPLYVSRDGGDHWNLIANHQSDQLTDYPGYIKDKTFIGWAIAKIRIDVSSKSGLMFSNWYGVSFSENGGLKFSGKNFKGLETNCLENITFGTNTSISFYTAPDHMPMRSRDGGMNYFSLPATTYTSSTSLIQSAYDSSLILFGGRVRSKGTGAIMLFKNGIVKPVFEFDSGYIQNIREDLFTRGTFYCTIDGKLNGPGGIYKSTDWGNNWEKLPFGFRPYMKTLPHQKEFIENELLNIVVGQKKNVCGSNQLMSLDPHHHNSLLVGEWTEGVFKSEDGGLSWKDISKGLPFHNDTASVLSVVVYDPYKEGRIYAGFIREGLWRSDNGGQTWDKIFPKDDSIFNVSTLHVGGVTSHELYIGSENLYWSDSPSTVLFSKDEGINWESIYDSSLGALRIKSLDVDTETGRIVLGTSGNGAFFAQRKK